MTEIKSYGRPPMLVEKVMEAVMILRGSEPTWAEAKRQLGQYSTKLYTNSLIQYIIHSEALMYRVGKRQLGQYPTPHPNTYNNHTINQ